ncbi:hypothetical protein C7M84_009459 [Penaeus vannamei]|uniref:Coatomer subunit zeta n=1 Tax=Penaeus vannamei TaxID=6689 RepID=A0A423T6N4_PENVA|nr:hypothetical protein C7M84_009459 [Penaeus vannamei]
MSGLLEPTLYIIKGIAILDNDGNRLLAKYYDPNVFPTVKEEKKFEKNLFQKTHRANAEVIMLDRLTCVYRSNVDLFFYVMGYSHENELILVSVLSCLYDAVSAILRKNVEKRTLLDNLDIIMLAVDEICDGGYLRCPSADEQRSRPVPTTHKRFGFKLSHVYQVLRRRRLKPTTKARGARSPPPPSLNDRHDLSLQAAVTPSFQSSVLRNECCTTCTLLSSLFHFSPRPRPSHPHSRHSTSLRTSRRRPPDDSPAITSPRACHSSHTTRNPPPLTLFARRTTTALDPEQARHLFPSSPGAPAPRIFSPVVTSSLLAAHSLMIQSSQPRLTALHFTDHPHTLRSSQLTYPPNSHRLSFSTLHPLATILSPQHLIDHFPRHSHFPLPTSPDDSASTLP